MKIIKLLLIVFLFFYFPKELKADDLPIGYSEWSTIKSGDENEISAIEYGRLLPLEWSDYSSDLPDTKFYKTGDDLKKYYAFEHFDNQYMWNDSRAKTLFIWDFEEKERLNYFYADVDTCVGETYTNYIAPPLRLYCDNHLIASIGVHGVLDNWEVNLDCDCTLLQLDMLDGGGEGRNSTYIVATFAATSIKQYAYVTKWSSGVDWRFLEPYEELYGEVSQIPTERTVYSKPIDYLINYELNGGYFDEDVIDKYTIFDEIILPIPKKQGYEFNYWLSNNEVLNKIEKGTYGDLFLNANYERLKPNIFISDLVFYNNDQKIMIDELINLVNGKAIDELDGDISKDIKVDEIEYELENIKINNPEYLDISKEQTISITFSITNSGNKKASIKKRFYILGQGEEINKLDDMKIYSRFINEEYQDSLDINSIWRQKDYYEILQKAFNKMKGM